MVAMVAMAGEGRKDVGSSQRYTGDRVKFRVKVASFYFWL